jgi:penicillin amidase
LESAPLEADEATGVGAVVEVKNDEVVAVEPDEGIEATETETETLVEHEPKPRRWIRGAAIVASVLALALVAATLGGWWFARRTFPRGGEIQLAGIHSPVRTTLDDLGVQRIYADNAHDLFYAQGFTEASNRFFQMDYRRHLATGTLAELVGDDGVAISSDRLVRTMDWAGVAAQEWEILDEATKSYLQAFSDGVNEYLSTRNPDTISLEYVSLRRDFGPQSIRPWSPIDSIVILKAIAWEMRSNIEDELDRALAYSALGDLALVERLFPSYGSANTTPMVAPGELPHETPPAAGITGAFPAGIPDGLNGVDINSIAQPQVKAAPMTPAAQPVAVLGRGLDVIPTAFGMGGSVGSNAFVVSGQHTESGKPLLANDLQLNLTVPSVFEQVGLHCTQVTAACPFNVAGFSVPGFPAVIIGHNGDLAWALADLRADTADFYTQVIRNDTTLRDGVWEPIDTRADVINVAGGAPVPITVRSVAGRPLVSDVIDLSAISNVPSIGWVTAEEFGVTLRWAALEPGRTAAGIFAVCLARDAQDIQAAADLLDAPAQVILFATVAGDIGMQTTGRIPVRNLVSDFGDTAAVPKDGTWPLDGRHAATDWSDWVPTTALPRVLNPARGYLVAANQPVLPEGAQPYLGADFDYGFRADRISDLITEKIAAGTPISVADMNAIQNDNLSMAAVELVPALLDVDLGSDWAGAGQELLQGWDNRMVADSSAAAYFGTAWNQVMQQTFWDELPEGVWPDGSSRWLVVVSKMLANPTDSFWDDRSTLNVTESRDEILQNAMQVARNQLTTRISGNTEYWKWGSLHKLRLENPVLGAPSKPFWLRYFANPTVTPTNGATLAINSTADEVDISANTVISGPVFRMVVDLGDFERSTWVNVPGNSGHIASAHYSDQLGAWIAGQTYPFYFMSPQPELQRPFSTFLPAAHSG